MPRSADETRRAILDAAEKRFAADGIVGATFADILAEAGQRNNSAIQYHFGDRIGLLEAIVERRAAQMAEHRARLVDALPPGPTVREVTEVIVAPLAGLLADPGGAAYLRIQAELLAHPQRAQLPSMLAEPWTRPGLQRAIALYGDAVGPGVAPVAGGPGSPRALLATSLIFHGLADHARTRQPDADDDAFVRALVGAVVAIVEAPLD